MKVLIHLMPGDSLLLCPSCKRPIVINEEAMTIKHIMPKCEWFDLHSAIANTLQVAANKQLNKTAN